VHQPCLEKIGHPPPQRSRAHRRVGGGSMSDLSSTPTGASAPPSVSPIRVRIDANLGLPAAVPHQGCTRTWIHRRLLGDCGTSTSGTAGTLGNAARQQMTTLASFGLRGQPTSLPSPCRTT